MNDFAPAVYDLVRQVRRGDVASYGMIASLLPGITPRMVGRGLAMLGDDRVPWQRIVLSSGAIAERPGANRQRDLLIEEGITFTSKGLIDWGRHAWPGPDEAWLERRGLDLIRFMEIRASWPQRR